MKPDIYTKAVLTVIALALTLIACNQYINPTATAQAQAAPFAGVQFQSTSTGYSQFFDPRTGEVWSYRHDGTGKDGKWSVGWHTKITKLGQDGVIFHGN